MSGTKFIGQALARERLIAVQITFRRRNRAGSRDVPHYSRALDIISSRDGAVAAKTELLAKITPGTPMGCWGLRNMQAGTGCRTETSVLDPSAACAAEIDEALRKTRCSKCLLVAMVTSIHAFTSTRLQMNDTTQVSFCSKKCQVKAHPIHKHNCLKPSLRQYASSLKANSLMLLQSKVTACIMYQLSCFNPSPKHCCGTDTV